MPDSATKPLAVRIPTVKGIEAYRPLPVGANRSPDGSEISVDNRSLRLDGQPWLPAMGEFHYARTPQNEWRAELLKMQLGGIDIVSTYVFWIHHEEIEGQFDWLGRRGLRAFAVACGELGLKMIVRIGPWCHGEVRNGGLPDWLLGAGVQARSDDHGYLEFARRWYSEIAAQTSGLLWKDGGPIIGIQCENEFQGASEHLLNLKRIAVEAGLDVPLYTRTGWPALTTPMLPGEFLPLHGGYPDGFWDRSLAEMPPGFAGNFLIRSTRSDASVAADQIGERGAGDERDNVVYPYLSCEIGGGMAASYHRRIAIDPRDIESLALAKIASGNNLQGYYMYHGGTNPEGRLSALQESQATGYWNDLPELSYDFSAPLGEFGQIRPHYHRLRRMHLFLRDFGGKLALMPLRLPDDAPAGPDDLSTLRWSLRENAGSGFVFVNNYQRLKTLPAKSGVQFELNLASGKLCVPHAPVEVPADACFFWPFNMDLRGVQLEYATAQPICRLDDSDQSYFVFREIAGIPAEFVFGAGSAALRASSGSLTIDGSGALRAHGVAPGSSSAIAVDSPDGATVHIILLDERQSLACWKSSALGRERIIVSNAPLLSADQGSISLQPQPAQECSIALLPAPPRLHCGIAAVTAERDGLFTRFTFKPAEGQSLAALGDVVQIETVRLAGPPRAISMGSQGVAKAPTESDFDQAAVWRLRVPRADASDCRRRIAIRYVGDAARLTLDGKLLLDNFYNGAPFELGLERYGERIYTGELLLEILPLQKQAPIYLPQHAWPSFEDAGDAVAELRAVEIIDELETKLTLKAPDHRNGAHAESPNLSASEAATRS